ncbi:MAG: hypothetical protein ACK4E0_10545 [Chitinophagaceae bacterium]
MSHFVGKAAGICNGARDNYFTKRFFLNLKTRVVVKVEADILSAFFHSCRDIVNAFIALDVHQDLLFSGSQYHIEAGLQQQVPFVQGVPRIILRLRTDLLGCFTNKLIKEPIVGFMYPAILLERIDQC